MSSKSIVDNYVEIKKSIGDLELLRIQAREGLDQGADKGEPESEETPSKTPRGVMLSRNSDVAGFTLDAAELMRRVP